MLARQRLRQRRRYTADLPGRPLRRAVATAVATVAAALAAGAIAAAAPALATSTASSAPATASTGTASTVAGQLQPWPVLKQGSNSLWPRVTVRSLQYLLNAHGARLKVDGHFGAKTKAAVESFQRSRKLAVTGVVNARTWRRLVVTVKRGNHGAAV